MAYSTNRESDKNLINKTDELNFFDIKHYVAQYGANLSAGQGVLIDTENDKIKKYFQEFRDINKLDDFFLQVVRDTNYWGRTVLMIDKSVDGTFHLSYTNNEWLQNVIKIDITPIRAELILKKVMGLTVFWMNVVYTPNEIFRSISYKTYAMASAQNFTPSNSNTDDKIPEEFDLPLHEVHNLGFVPIVELTNLPSRNVIQTSNDFTMLSDDYSVQYLALHINNGLRQMLKEEVMGKTRAFGDIPKSQINEWIQNNKGILLKDFIIKTNGGNEKGSDFNITPGTYDGMKWFEPTKEKINLYFMGCGYSPPFNSGAQQTEAETLYSKDLDQRTTKAKRRRYTEVLNDLFKKLLVYKGLMKSIYDEPEFTISIKENVVYNQLQMGQFLADNIANGFMTRVEAIMAQRDIDNLEQAENILKEIEKDQEKVSDTMLENDKKANDLMGNMGVDGDADPNSEKEKEGK